MGLLDDAIREHLQLKREHGADPTELARLEREALGPPVRETQEVLDTGGSAPAAATATAEPAAEEVTAAVGGEATSATPPPAGDPATEMWDAEEVFGDATPAEPVHGPGGDEPAAAAPGEAAPPAALEPPPAAAAPEPAPAPDPASAPVSDPDPGTGEDVLEETPEFLQETPEHDRLWFEQKPPRDFDFDG